MIRVGAHVSASGALDRCIDRAAEIGAETIQIFASAPQSWRPHTHGDAVCALLRERSHERAIAPVFVHGIYLINLGTADAAHLGRSTGALKQALKFCEQTGARGVIFHVGSHKGAGFDAVLPQIAEAIRESLDYVPGESALILENSAGAGGSIGSRFAELGAIIRAAGSERVLVCLDTCHAFAAGYDLATAGGVDSAMSEFDREIGLNRLIVIHANDSKAGLGAGLDRHENIGEGHIGADGFRTITHHPAFQDLPFILEVPGFDGGGPDRRNIELLKSIAAESG
jgi:deoxyribonuclease IV